MDAMKMISKKTLDESIFASFSDGPEVDDRSAGRFIDPRAISAHPDTAILINNRHGTRPKANRLHFLFPPADETFIIAATVARTNGKREVERGWYEYV